LSASDRDDSKKRWPKSERRQGTERRKIKERRLARAVDSLVSRWSGEERRIAERRTGRDRRDESAWLSVKLDATSIGFSPEQGLLAAASAARDFAQASYSHFKVGAALETAEGVIVTGCNIENATYGLTLCAERVALVKALSEGHTVFTRIAVVADTDAPTPPCGPCRQLLWEYCGDVEVILGNLAAMTGRYRLASLLPLPFDRRLLDH
jgi:cytidine deaminase